MKKILFGLLTLGITNLCAAQTVDKKGEVKFTPPVIKKDEDVKFTPPVIKKDEEVKFTPPVIKQNKTTKKKIKFTSSKSSVSFPKNSTD
jgi:hypothetical protein